MPLAADVGVLYRLGPTPNEFGYLVQPGQRVFRGSVVALCADGTICPAGSATANAPVAIVGLAQVYQDQTGAAGAIPSALSQSGRRVHCRRGTVQLPFDVAPTAANVNAAVYAVDDATLTLTATGHLRAGTLVGFDEAGLPWVQI